MRRQQNHGNNKQVSGIADDHMMCFWLSIQYPGQELVLNKTSLLNESGIWLFFYTQCQPKATDFNS